MIMESGGGDLSEAAYDASGCSSITDFISSSALICSLQGVQQHAYLRDDDVCIRGDSYLRQTGEIRNLHFSLKKLRAREGQGSLPRFLHALPTCIPSCTRLRLSGVELASLDELAALCRGIASPLCTLHALDLDFRLKVASAVSADVPKRLIGDALVHNTSLQRLTIISQLCSQDLWIPCSIQDLHVKLEADDTLDVLLGVLTSLAQNSISLTTLSISGPHNPSCDRSALFPLAMLDSERQLGITLSTNTSLTSLHLYNLIMPNEAFCLLVTSLNKNDTLTSLTLCGYLYLPGEVVRLLFAALEENRSLTSLDLSYSDGEDWPSASSILDSLRINGTLTSVELLQTPYEEEYLEEEEDGIWGAIFAQLDRNGESGSNGLE